MVQISKIREFDYTNDYLIVADMDKRDTSYVVLLVNKLNDLINECNALNVRIKTLEKNFDAGISEAEKKAANKITA